jgi:hypothetical protein
VSGGVFGVAGLPPRRLEDFGDADLNPVTDFVGGGAVVQGGRGSRFDGAQLAGEFGGHGASVTDHGGWAQRDNG